MNWRALLSSLLVITLVSATTVPPCSIAAEIASETTSFQSQFAAAQESFAKGNYQLAEKQFKEAIETGGGAADERQLLKCLLKQSDLLVQLGNSADATSSLERAQALAGKLADEDAKIECQVVRGELFYFLDKKEAGDVLEKALAVQQKLTPKGNARTARILAQLSRFYRDDEKYSIAMTLVSRGLKILEEESHADQIQLAILYRIKGSILTEENKFTEATKVLEKSRAILESCNAIKHPVYADVLVSRADVYMALEEYSSAEKLLQVALKIEEQVVGVNCVYVANTLSRLSKIYRAQKKFAAAERLAFHVLKIFEEQTGAESTYVASELYRLAVLQLDLNQSNRAKRLAERALSIMEKLCGKDSPLIVPIVESLALAERRLHNWETAESLYRRAAELTKANVGANHPDYADCMLKLAYFYDERNDYSKAESQYKQALKIYTAANRESDRLSTLRDLGDFYQKTKDYQRALSYFQKAVPKVQSKRDWRSEAAAFDGLGRVNKDLGNFTEAEKYYKQELEILEANADADPVALANVLTRLVIAKVSKVMKPDAANRVEELAEAESIHRRVLSIREKIFGLRDERTLSTLKDLNWLRREGGQEADFELLSKELEATTEKEQSSDTLDSELILFARKRLSKDPAEFNIDNAVERRQRLIKYYTDEGDYAKAELDLEDSNNMVSTAGVDDKGIAADLMLLSAIYESKGQYVKASELAKKALQICEKLNDRTQYLAVAKKLAGLFLMGGQPSDAFDVYTSALAYIAAIPDSEATELSEGEEIITPAGGIVGLQIEKLKDKRIVVDSVVKNSPSFLAGAKAGWEIVAVDGNSVKELEIDNTLKLIRGPADTVVLITFLVDGQTKNLKLTRARPPRFSLYKELQSGLILYDFGFALDLMNNPSEALSRYNEAQARLSNAVPMAVPSSQLTVFSLLANVHLGIAIVQERCGELQKAQASRQKSENNKTVCDLIAELVIANEHLKALLKQNEILKEALAEKQKHGTAGQPPSASAPLQGQQGNASSGSAPSGSAPSGNAPSGNAPSSNAPSGNAPSGKAPPVVAPTGGNSAEPPKPVEKLYTPTRNTVFWDGGKTAWAGHRESSSEVLYAYIESNEQRVLPDQTQENSLNAAIKLRKDGKPAKALQATLEAFNKLRSQQSSDPRFVAYVLWMLGDLYNDLSDATHAMRLYRAARNHLEKAVGGDSLQLADMEELLVERTLMLNPVSSVSPLLARIYKTRVAKLGEKDPRVANTWISFAMAAKLRGSDQELLSKTFEVWSSFLSAATTMSSEQSSTAPRKNLRVNSSSMVTGIVKDMGGDERMLNESCNVMLCLSYLLAANDFGDGQYKAIARRSAEWADLCARSLAESTDALSPNDARTAKNIRRYLDVAAAYGAQKLYNESLESAVRAADIAKVSNADALFQEAAVKVVKLTMIIGDVDKAGQLAKQYLQSREFSNSLDTANLLDVLAEAELKGNNLAEALAAAQRSLKIRTSSDGSTDAQLATSYFNWASVLLKALSVQSKKSEPRVDVDLTGLPKDLDGQCKEALESARKYAIKVGDRNGDRQVAKISVVMAELAASVGDLKTAIGHMNNAASIHANLGEPDLVITTIEENATLARWNYELKNRTDAQQSAYQASSFASKFLDTQFRNLSYAERLYFVENTLAKLTGTLLTVSDDRDSVTEAYKFLCRWKGQLLSSLRKTAYPADSQEAVSKALSRVRAQLSTRSEKADPRKYAELSVEKQLLERILSGDGIDPKLDAIKLCLYNDEALIDIFRYVPINSENSFYAAFVVTAKGDPQLVQLGQEDLLEEALESWKSELFSSSESETANLRRTLWSALANSIPKGTSKLFVVPDGELVKAPWSLLAGESGDGSRNLISQLESAGRLITLRRPKITVDEKKPDEVLLVGDINYSKFPPMPGAAKEIADLTHLAQKADLKVNVLRGEAATSESVTRLMPMVSFIHVATRGIAGSASGEIANTRDVILTDKSSNNPLRDSGLLLSEMKSVSNDNRDHVSDVVYADQLVQLDLRNCKLAVLSYCDSGNGPTIVGQGTLGLPAALAAAGTRCTLASLWPVDDASTCTLMDEFYRSLWEEHKQPAEALLDAQAALRKNPKWSRPHFWAGWTLAGEGW